MIFLPQYPFSSFEIDLSMHSPPGIYAEWLDLVNKGRNTDHRSKADYADISKLLVCTISYIVYCFLSDRVRLDCRYLEM